MQCYGMILAGGDGTRFWPLSRRSNPKQMLNITGRAPMIMQTIGRLSNVVAQQDIFIITSAGQGAQIRALTGEVMAADHVLLEPQARNTAACIGYAAFEILRKYGDGVMIVCPSDHYIADDARFAAVLRDAAAMAEETGKLVTVGITPNRPATGFGYIECCEDAVGTGHTVASFHEKPDEETAKTYIATGRFLWNSGMFIWKASAVLERFRRYVPDIYADLEKIGDAMGTPAEQETLNTVYPGIRRISVDYAVMEPAAAGGDVLVLPGDFGWNDIGSWDAMDTLRERDENGNILVGDCLTIDAGGNIAYSSGRPLILLGVEGLIAVQTPDAVLVTTREKAQEIRKVTALLKQTGREELL